MLSNQGTDWGLAGGLTVRSPTEWGCTIGLVGTANSLVRWVNYQKGK